MSGTSAMRELLQGMAQGRDWPLHGNPEEVRKLLWRVYEERYHAAPHHRGRFALRVNLPAQREEVAAYAGWIGAENPASGPYQGISFVWFPGEGGSVAGLVIGTEGFGADAAILGRPGHRRRLRAISRLHRGAVWVKPDPLDQFSEVPEPVRRRWPPIDAALGAYGRVIYAAVAVRGPQDGGAVEDLLDLFFHERGTPLTGRARERWEGRLRDIAAALFPRRHREEVLSLLAERRFVVLEGPPGTGKTRLALEVARSIGSATVVQFHAARTYEDFVVGLFPVPAERGLAFEVRPGDLLLANEQAREREHVLVLDEINRADLARVLGEAIFLFEPGEVGRKVRLPRVPAGWDPELALSPRLMVLGTRNTADRSIARIDLAIRRRFAFLDLWPDLEAVAAEGVPLATDCFADVLHTFAEYADEETLSLVPGHAYFLDPRPELGPVGRERRVARRLRFELVPLLRQYLEDRLCGAAGEAVAGLAERIEAELAAWE